MHINQMEAWRAKESDLSALVRRAGILLEQLDIESSDARVSTLPDARTIRYYQSAGLLSPPLRYEGRQAVYGFDHLMQVAVIKLLQAQGLSLAQVQRAMVLADAAALENAVVEALDARTAQVGESASPPGVARGSRIFADAQEMAVQAPVASSIAKVSPGRPAFSPRPITPPTRPVPRALISAELAPGILLTIDPACVDSADTVIQALARALQAELEATDRDFPEEK